jgi:acetylornithine deacetylase
MTAPTSTSAESRINDALDEVGLVEATQRLVRIASHGGNESAAQKLVAALMADVGLDTDVWEIDLDEVRAHPHCSYEIDRDHALGVVGTLEGAGSGPTLILNGHVDVVPPGDAALWTHPPFEGAVVGGRIYGRGALDMKGPLMAGLFALKAIRDSGLTLAGTVHLQSVVGEEDGGIGTLATVLRGYRGDAAIVMEPTNFAVARAQAGCLNFRVRVPGLAAHGAVRSEGVSAFEKLFLIYAAIQRLEQTRNADARADDLFSRYEVPFPISIGTMTGGDWASSVPDHAAMEGRMGVRPGESFADAKGQLEAAVTGASAVDPFLKVHPPVVEWWGGRFLAMRTPTDDPIVEILRSSAEAVLGQSVPLEGVPFGADSGLLSQVGETPTVLFGAGDIRRAHRPDESVEIEDLVLMAKMLAVAAIRFCGTV